jgi:mannose-6-phosphate isomerase-like protein (cupin superfamily)
MHDRLSFDQAEFQTSVAHDGINTIRFARATGDVVNSACNFIDLCIVPAGSSIGVHTHSPDDEEIYVVIEGRGRMTVDDRSFHIGAGDVIVNRPGGTHGLINDGPAPLRMVVVDLATST